MPFHIKLCFGNPEQCQVILLLGYGSAVVRVDVRRKGSLPSLALPSVWEGQALAARILPLPSEKIEMYILALKCNQSIPKLSGIKKTKLIKQKT